MSDLKKYLNQQLKNKNFKKEWDNLQPEMELIRTIIKARVDKNITQKELSVKTGINQADISKFETGVRKPSLKILKKIANALDMVLKLNSYLNNMHKITIKMARKFPAFGWT